MTAPPSSTASRRRGWRSTSPSRGWRSRRTRSRVRPFAFTLPPPLAKAAAGVVAAVPAARTVPRLPATGARSDSALALGLGLLAVAMSGLRWRRWTAVRAAARTSAARCPANLSSRATRPRWRPVGLQQFEHLLVGAARPAGQVPGHDVLEVVVADRHRVGVTQRDERDLAAVHSPRPGSVVSRRWASAGDMAAACLEVPRHSRTRAGSCRPACVRR